MIAQPVVETKVIMRPSGQGEHTAVYARSEAIEMRAPKTFESPI